MTTIKLLLLMMLATVISMPSRSLAAPSQESGSALFTFDNHHYLFPAGTHTNSFHDELGNWQSAEILVYHKFWQEVLGRVAPLDGWMAIGDSSGPRMIYLTKPSDLIQFIKQNNPRLPPVRGPVKLKSKQGSVMFWTSLDPDIYIEGLTYVTFEGRTDFYLECTERDIGDWQKACDVLWYDGGIVHKFGIAGDWIARTPPSGGFL